MNSKNLIKYKGWRYTTLSVNTIEYEFYPYKLLLCSNEDFNNNVYLHKTIRCLIFEGIIIDLKLN